MVKMLGVFSAIDAMACLFAPLEQYHVPSSPAYKSMSAVAPALNDICKSDAVGQAVRFNEKPMETGNVPGCVANVYTGYDGGSCVVAILSNKPLLDDCVKL